MPDADGIAAACKEVLEYTCEVGLNLHSHYGDWYWIGVLFQGPYTIDDFEEIIYDYSAKMGDLP